MSIIKAMGGALLIIFGAATAMLLVIPWLHVFSLWVTQYIKVYTDWVYG